MYSLFSTNVKKTQALPQTMAVVQKTQTIVVAVTNQILTTVLLVGETLTLATVVQTTIASHSNTDISGMILISAYAIYISTSIIFARSIS
jgi:hypothetical protein